MPIPDYQTIMLPLLRLLEDGRERSVRWCTDALADHFQLSQEERARLLPSGQQLLFYNRVGWARTYLKKAGLITSPRRGVVQITPRGLEVLRRAPEKIDVDYLMQFEEFREFRTRDSMRAKDEEKESRAGSTPDDSGADPVERIEQAFSLYQKSLADELLEYIHRVTPAFFERLVLQLLVAMGYGGRLQQPAQLVGGSGDEGIDSIINEDKLGLEVIYIQAKKWSSPVGRPEIQKFVGALHGKRAKKGVFITSSEFTREAWDYVAHLEPRVVLVDGKMMARLMIEYDVGVTTRTVYKLKSIDTDFFDEES